jgi:hypothetical protein
MSWGKYLHGVRADMRLTYYLFMLFLIDMNRRRFGRARPHFRQHRQGQAQPSCHNKLIMQPSFFVLGAKFAEATHMLNPSSLVTSVDMHSTRRATPGSPLRLQENLSAPAGMEGGAPAWSGLYNFCSPAFSDMMVRAFEDGLRDSIREGLILRAWSTADQAR